jgi:hypothetical protein
MPRNDSETVVDSFRAPGNGSRPGWLQTHRRARQAEFVARTNLEYISEIGVGGLTYFGKLPSEELFPANRRRQPLKPDLNAIII